MDTVLNRLQTWLQNARIFASSRSRRRFIVHLFTLVLAFVVATVLIRRHAAFLTDTQALRELIRGYGIWAPVVLILLQTVQVVAAPIPGQVLAIVAGYLFGAWWGTLYNMIGIIIGSTIAFWISRRYGRAYVENIVHEEALGRFDAVSDDYGRSALFFFFRLCSFGTLRWISRVSDAPAKVVDSGFEDDFTEFKPPASRTHGTAERALDA